MAGPLDGIKVFDMTTAGVGPNATMLLAIMGANVIRFEMPGPDGRMARRTQPLPQQHGVNTTYMTNNFNKRSVFFNFRNEDHRAAAYMLLSEADVFVNNMRYGVAERLGFGYEDACRNNPHIIYVFSSGWGTSGPMRDLPAYDYAVQAFSGSASVNGDEGGKPELLRFNGHYDHVTSHYLALAVLLALYNREETGKGAYIELSLLGCALCTQVSRLGEYFATGEPPKPLGSASSITAPHQAFQCRDKKYIAVAALDNEQWKRLCQALGKPELIRHPHFATNPDRVEHRKQLAAIMGTVFRTKDIRWWEIQLTKYRVPHSRFISWNEFINLPQARANGHVMDLDTGRWGTMYVANAPWKFGSSPAKVRPNPEEGEHTAYILANPTFDQEGER